MEKQALTSTTGAWNGSPASYAYRWEACNSAGHECQTIGGATDSSYTLVAADVGRTMRVTVTATNAGGSTPATSAISARVKAATSPPAPRPTNTVPPAISGADIEGDTLQSTTGSWEGAPKSYAYRWQSCDTSGESCVTIAGATSSTYRLTASDVGDAVRVTVTATNAGGSTPATSSATAAIVEAASPPPPPPPPPVNITLPEISGASTAGKTLTATRGTWEGNPTSYAYQWEICNTSGAGCTNIAGATTTGYKLAAADVGDTIRVTVTASNEGGPTPATSVATAKVTEAPPPPPPPSPPVNTALPEISGATTESQTVTATEGAWTNSPTSYAYQWEICDAAGESCSDVAGASATSYTLVAGDVGHTMRVTVTATNEGGSTPATSAHTATVASPAKQPPPSPTCTQTVSSTTSAASAVQAATGEAAICLKAGAYGALDLSGAHAKDVTVEPEPGTSASVQGVNLAEGSSGIAIHNFTITGGVSLAAGDSHITIDHNDIDGQGPGGIGEGVQTLSVNCSAPNAPTYSGCMSTTPDTYITINGNKIHGYGEGDTEDAIHLNDWEHVTITANDIYDLEEHGNHTDGMQSVFGGHYMTFAYNYEHDNQSQGFFIKDGDVSEVTVNENLFVRNNNEPELYPGGEYNIQIFNTTGLAITDNTVWDGQADIIRAEGAAEALTATVNHNVEENFDVLHEGGPAYTLTEDYDVFAEEPFTFSKGPHSKVEAHPDFVNPAGEDYELASNPDGIGVDWQPSEYVYGPTGD
jgi:hypothetical protein